MLIGVLNLNMADNYYQILTKMADFSMQGLARPDLSSSLRIWGLILKINRTKYA